MRLLHCWVGLYYPLALGWVLFSLPSITATSFVRNYPCYPGWIRSSPSSTCIYAASSCALAPTFLIRFHRLLTSSSKNAPTSYTPTPYADLELGDSVDHESRACIVHYDESVGVSAHAPAQGVDEGAPSGGKEEQARDVCAHSHGDRRGASRRKRKLHGGKQHRGRSGRRRRGGGGTGAS